MHDDATLAAVPSQAYSDGMVRALLVALVWAGFAAPALENPGVPCVGFYFTTCSLIELVPNDPSQAPAEVEGAVCRRIDCPGG
jgi:hypothetical protein